MPILKQEHEENISYSQHLIYNIIRQNPSSWLTSPRAQSQMLFGLTQVPGVFQTCAFFWMGEPGASMACWPPCRFWDFGWLGQLRATGVRGWEGQNECGLGWGRAVQWVDQVWEGGWNWWPALRLNPNPGSWAAWCYTRLLKSVPAVSLVQIWMAPLKWLGPVPAQVRIGLPTYF